jgi:hypothetical protein
VALQHAQQTGGRTRLGLFVIGNTVWSVVLIGMAAGLGALLLVILGSRAARKRSDRFDGILRSIGISEGAAARARLASELIASVPAIVVAGAVGITVTAQTGSGPLALVIGLAFQLLVSAASILYSLVRRANP